MVNTVNDLIEMQQRAHWCLAKGNMMAMLEFSKSDHASEESRRWAELYDRVHAFIKYVDDSM